MTAGVQRFDAVLFDLGGVLVSSPFTGFAAYERRAGLPDGTIRRINATDPDTNAWARYERGEIDRDEFAVRFEDEARALGVAVDAHAVLASMRGERVAEMIDVVERLRHRLPLGLITNNLAPMDRSASLVGDVLAWFGTIVESSVEGLRKPDPAIYRLACDRLGVPPDRCVFLDDLGVNLKPARALGMHTIKVVDPVVAAGELAALVGM